MAVKIVPVGLNDYNSNFLHEIIEDYLYQNWSDADIVPRNQIKFSYKVDQNVSPTARHAIKCYDGGSFENESMYNNDTGWKEIHDIDVIIESRGINNFVNDAPIEIFHMKNKIRDIINRDRTALRNVGIHMMTYVDDDRVEQDEQATYIYRMKVDVRCLQFMERKEA